MDSSTMDSSDSADYEYHRCFNCNLIKEEFIATETDNNIDFHFCMHEEFSKWILRQYSSEPEFVRLYLEPVVVNHVVSMSRKEFSDSPELRTLVEEELIKVFALEEDEKDIAGELIDHAFLEASRSVTSDNHADANGVLNLHFNALMEHRYVVDDDMDIDDCSVRMVPAADSSIEGLLKKVAAVDSCCSICLEDLSGSGDQDEEVVVLLSMACSHVFHGDCIGTWLKTCHYCPICRFEMPS